MGKCLSIHRATRTWRKAAAETCWRVIWPDCWLNRLSKRLKRRIAAVKVAVNATSLAVDWNPLQNQGLYVALRKAVDDAISAGAPTGEKVQPAAFFWLQGEADTGSAEWAAAYQRNLWLIGLLSATKPA